MQFVEKGKHMWIIRIILMMITMGFQGSVFASNHTQIIGDINASKALKQLYGNVTNHNDKALMHAVWAGYLKEVKRKYPQYYEHDENNDGDVYIAFEKEYKEDGTSKYILITQTRPHGDETHECHSCFVLVGGAIFRKTNNTWILESENKIIALMGKWGWINRDVFGFGVMDKMELVRIGQNKHGVILIGDDVHGGYEYHYISLIGSNGAQLDVLLENGFEGPGSGACTDRAAKNKQGIQFKILSVKGSEYYDIELFIKKNTGKCGKVKTLMERHNYVCSNGKYIKK